MHTVRSFTNASNTFLENLDLPEHPKFFSYLPLSHIAERVGLEMSAFFRGASMTFSDSLATFPNDLEATQPHVFFAVPRIWAKISRKNTVRNATKKINQTVKASYN